MKSEKKRSGERKIIKKYCGDKRVEEVLYKVIKIYIRNETEKNTQNSK